MRLLSRNRSNSAPKHKSSGLRRSLVIFAVATSIATVNSCEESKSFGDTFGLVDQSLGLEYADIELTMHEDPNGNCSFDDAISAVAVGDGNLTFRFIPNKPGVIVQLVRKRGFPLKDQVVNMPMVQPTMISYQLGKREGMFEDGRFLRCAYAGGGFGRSLSIVR